MIFNITFSVILVFSAIHECASFEFNNEIKGNPEEYFFGGWEHEGRNKHSFPEFEKIAEFLQPLINHADNYKCEKQLEILVKSLKNSSLWAVQMFDASSKIPNGLLTSDAYDLGNYDSCVEINLKREKNDNIFGKYCLINFSVKKLDITHSEDDAQCDIQFWEKLMVPIFNYGFINNLYRSAICVPNECLPQNIENIFRFLFNNTSRKFKKHVEISVSDDACATANADEFLGLAYVKKIIPLVFLWVIVTTVFDLLGWFYKSKYFWTKTAMNFSAYKNYKILTSTNCRESISIVNSLKVYTVVCLVITRRISFFLAGPIMNRKDVDQVFYQSLKEIFFSVSNNIVADTLLVLDGFLHFYKVFYYFRRRTKISIWRIYVFQFLNMCPLYITAILFYGYVYEGVGTGPMWKERTGRLVKNCRENWMFNLLNLNNFIKVNDMCIFESWYFAVVAQCFVMVPILAKITQKTSGKIVLKLLIGAVLVLTVVKFYNSQESFHSFDNKNGRIYWHQKLSTKTLDRASAYFIGILSAIVYFEAKISKRKFFFKTCRRVPFRAGIGVLFLGLYAQLNFKTLSSYIWSSKQILWCLFISCIVVGVSIKKLTGFAPLLTGKYLFPLGRLSYSYLLVLDIIQIYTIGIMRTLDYFSLSRMVWISSADLLATYVVAFVFYMVVHRPMSNILHEIFIGV